jgi:hypothetical protein
MQSRWSECFDVAKGHIEDNIWSYYDLNTMMVCLGSKHKEEADRLVASIKATIKLVPSIYTEDKILLT